MDKAVLHGQEQFPISDHAGSQEQPVSPAARDASVLKRNLDGTLWLMIDHLLCTCFYSMSTHERNSFSMIMVDFVSGINLQDKDLYKE